MSKLEEVPPKTPWIDRVETIPKAGPIIGAFMRLLRGPWRRRHEKKVQDEIDRRYHDRLRNGQPESKP